MVTKYLGWCAAVLLGLAAAPAAAQAVETVDPNAPPPAATTGAQAAPAAETPPSAQSQEWTPVETTTEAPAETIQVTPAPMAAPGVPRRDIFTAAEDLFGRGAEGLAGLLENILRDQGEPIAYISGQEASGAFFLGARYGSGVMRHQVEGDKDVYWTGPSLGFDVGANANKVFVLVYNLYDTQNLFRRYPGGEGNAYFVGGFTAQYLRRGDVVLIPIRLGVGLRLGINGGYMRFSEQARWLPL